MLGALARSLFGTANDRFVKGLDKPVAKINALEPEMQDLSDDQIRERAMDIRARLADGRDVDDVLEETFALVREVEPDSIGVSISYPMPNTRFHQIVESRIEATNWRDSGDLQVMFQGTFPTSFYRELSEALHAKDWDAIEQMKCVAC